MCSGAEHVLILEHNFASEFYAAVCESFSSAYPDKEVLNKTMIQQNSWNYGCTNFKQFISCNSGL
jgi:hypothetical protein